MPELQRLARYPFGLDSAGEAIDRYALCNRYGLQVDVLTHGARISRVQLPGDDGQPLDIALGFDDMAGYIAHPGECLGAIAGRYANRIANAQFVLNGHTYALPANDGPHTLHGGPAGFDQQCWAANTCIDDDSASVCLSMISPDGDMGFPGRLTIEVVYTLDDDNRLSINYQATSDADTVINLTNHAYFNLAGAGQATIDEHTLQMTASRYTPVGSQMIPTGELRSVDNSALDCRQPTTLAHALHADEPPIRQVGGYDFNWVLDNPGNTSEPAAVLCHPATGRRLQVFTDQPGLQVYTANGFDGSIIGRHDLAYPRHAAVALEAQRFPDTPNQPDFGSARLRAGQRYRQCTAYVFDWPGNR